MSDQEVTPIPALEVRPIPDHLGYYAGSDGHIYSSKGCGDGGLHPLVRLSEHPGNNGYFYASLSTLRNGKRGPQKITVHKLVCTAWHGVLKPNQEVRHLSHKRDNRPCVLRPGTRGQNAYDNVRQKKQTIKLSPRLALEIRLMVMDGFDYLTIGKLYGVSYHTVYYIAELATWRTRAAIPKGYRDWQRLHLMRGAVADEPVSEG